MHEIKLKNVFYIHHIYEFIVNYILILYIYIYICINPMLRFKKNKINDEKFLEKKKLKKFIYTFFTRVLLEMIYSPKLAETFVNFPPIAKF